MALSHRSTFSYPGFIDGNAGVTTQALGGLAAADWLAGIVPWWNPYSGVGLPLAAEQQNSAFFLPFVLILRLFDGVILLKIILQIFAGLACFALSKELHLPRRAALTAALCFEINGTFAWFGHGPIMPIAFLPLLLFGIERARRFPWQGALFVALGIAWSLLAGFPEVAYLDGLLALAWAVLRMIELRRATYVIAICGGGIVGSMIAAPSLLAFVEALPLSFLGNHLDFRASVFAPTNRAALFFPYLFGPPMYGGLKLEGAASLAQFLHWFGTSGFFDLSLLLVAATAVRYASPDLGLRWLLAIWITFGMGRALGVPGIADLVDFIPLVRNTMFHLYIVPSCQMAVIILAAHALSDWESRRLSRRIVASRALLVLALACITLPPALPVIRALSTVPGYWVLPVFSLTFAIGMLLATAQQLTKNFNRALPYLLVVEGSVLFFLPLLGGTPRPRSLDMASLEFLQRHVDLQRVTSVAALTPNYGAWFDIPAIDHNYLPVPKIWVDDVRSSLMPEMDGVNNFSSQIDLSLLEKRLPEWRDHGVGFLLVPPTADPLGQEISFPAGQGSDVAASLAYPVSGSIAGSRFPSGRVAALSVTIGTFRGAAKGAIILRLCQGSRCSTGTASLGGAIDNAPIPIRLSPPLNTTTGVDLSYRLASAPLTSTVPAIWLRPIDPGDELEAVRPGLAPRLTLDFETPLDDSGFRRVFEGKTMDIYQLSTPAAYFSAPDCSLSVFSRTKLRSDCRRPSTLVRLELAYPGWRAQVNDAMAKVGTLGIYQTVSLPEGRAFVRFVYAPPWVGYAWLASALGIVGLCIAGLLGWRGRSSGR